MSCGIPYIPEHLHTNGRPDIPTFQVGENLYRRTSNINDPFGSITLTDVSVNRQGSSAAPLSFPDDVLYNYSPDKIEGERIREDIVTLEVKEVNDQGVYRKELANDREEGGSIIQDTCVIELGHRKEDCNYAHCSFKVFLNGEEITFDNNKKLLGHNRYKVLRTMCKQELAKMIVKREVRMNWDEDNKPSKTE